MQTKDTVEKTLESYNDVFADIVNALLFDGEEVITEQSLTDAQPFSYYKMNGEEIHTQERDVAKYWQNGQIRLSLFGLENQTAPDKNMPLRIIGYDGAAYRSQLLPSDGQAQKCYPVLTLVLYFGTERRWTEPRSLKTRLQIPERLKPFVSDYKIHVFELAWLAKKRRELFKSDFREVVEYLRAKRLHTIYRGSERKVKHILEILDLFAIMSKESDMFKANAPRVTTRHIIEEKQGDMTMYDMIQAIMDEGAKKTEKQILSLFKKLYKAGRDEDVKRATEDNAYLKKLMDEWQK